MADTLTAERTDTPQATGTMQNVEAAVQRLDRWIERSGWVGYDPFDGLSAPLPRRLTFDNPLLAIALQQTVRRFPLNLRPLLGITKKHSTKAMGYFASGYLRLYQSTGRVEYLDKAKYCLEDLREYYSEGYSGYAWGNAFDYTSRSMNFLPADTPTIVWTAFIGWAFVEAWELLGDRVYLDVARSACEFTLRDLSRGQVTEDQLCFSYFPHHHLEIHNANMLAASLLGRVYGHTGEPELHDAARKAVNYTMRHQHPDGAWWYGEGRRWHWVDGYHTGFVLDALYYYMQSTGDSDYAENLVRGMRYYRQALFEGVIPKHYRNHTYPIDIQPVAQAIQSFALIPEEYGGDVDWAEQVAGWAIANMQDADGHFYFRKHRFGTNKTACLHWGQSTMLAALALLLQRRKGTLDWSAERESVRVAGPVAVPEAEASAAGAA